ncbi:hypothetical protein HanIR_Chr01g0040631 [Helianthus annuus]|nr:hypothetical protein HanIR_Chr01g0040631 [Helianthus annuus]
MFVRLHAPSRRMDYSRAMPLFGSWVLLYHVTCFIVICCHVVSVMICLYVYMHLVMFSICYLFSISFGIQVI